MDHLAVQPTGGPPAILSLCSFLPVANFLSLTQQQQQQQQQDGKAPQDAASTAAPAATPGPAAEPSSSAAAEGGERGPAAAETAAALPHASVTWATNGGVGSAAKGNATGSEEPARRADGRHNSPEPGRLSVTQRARRRSGLASQCGAAGAGAGGGVAAVQRLPAGNVLAITDALSGQQQLAHMAHPKGCKVSSGNNVRLTLRAWQGVLESSCASTHSPAPCAGAVLLCVAGRRAGGDGCVGPRRSRLEHSRPGRRSQPTFA